MYIGQLQVFQELVLADASLDPRAKSEERHDAACLRWRTDPGHEEHSSAQTGHRQPQQQQQQPPLTWLVNVAGQHGGYRVILVVKRNEFM